MTARAWVLRQVELELGRARESGSATGRAYHRGQAAGMYERLLREEAQQDWPAGEYVKHLEKAAALCAELADLHGQALRQATEGMRVGRAIAGHLLSYEAGTSADAWAEEVPV